MSFNKRYRPSKTGKTIFKDEKIINALDTRNQKFLESRKNKIKYLAHLQRIKIKDSNPNKTYLVDRDLKLYNNYFGTVFRKIDLINNKYNINTPESKNYRTTNALQSFISKYLENKRKKEINIFSEGIGLGKFELQLKKELQKIGIKTNLSGSTITDFKNTNKDNFKRLHFGSTDKFNPTEKYDIVFSLFGGIYHYPSSLNEIAKNTILKLCYYLKKDGVAFIINPFDPKLSPRLIEKNKLINPHDPKLNPRSIEKKNQIEKLFELKEKVEDGIIKSLKKKGFTGYFLIYMNPFENMVVNSLIIKRTR